MVQRMDLRYQAVQSRSTIKNISGITNMQNGSDKPHLGGWLRASRRGTRPEDYYLAGKCRDSHRKCTREGQAGGVAQVVVQ
jgi:hypothetical protein